ncbi:MAG: GPR1/FUN34/YaaH family transporter [Methanomassiliicoccaceae archaeon]|jgi:succinate-acetate transporter protein|nr:GPR1/FUN34/YaaH family transporter [Methanomassiliicoccaceae archaeon]
MENIQEIKIKDGANPTAAGLVALAVACFCFFALLEGHVDASARTLIGCWLIGGFVVQVIVGLMDLKEGNHAGGNTFLFFSAFFMLATGMEMLIRGVMGVEVDARIDGWAWAALSIVMILWLPAFFKKIGILSFIVLFVAIALPFIAIRDLGYTAELGVLAHIPAWTLLIAGLLAIYLCSAIVVNKAYGKTIYPM